MDFPLCSEMIWIDWWNRDGSNWRRFPRKAVGSQVAMNGARGNHMQQSAAFKSPERVHLSLLASIEKRCLTRLAEQMPAWIHSDHLTALGFVSMMLAGLSYWWAKTNQIGLLLAIVFLALNWFGDSLDGTLARVRNRQRPRYGFYVDHIIDAFGVLFLLGGMALSGYMSVPLAAGMLIVYYLLSIEIMLATISFGTFKLSFGKLGPTELRILLCIGNVILLFRPIVHIFGEPFKLFDVGGIVAIAAMLVVVVNSAIQNTRRLYEEEKL